MHGMRMMIMIIVMVMMVIIIIIIIINDKIVPVIIGALGTIKKGLDQNFQLLQGHPTVTELQKVTLMSTANIIRKVLG